MSKEEKKVPVDNQEDYILKKIRYYQGTIDDYETFWNKKTAEGEKEECPETREIKKKNDDLNKAFVIVPVEKDDTVMAKDIVSGKDLDEKPLENSDAQPVENEEGGKDAKKDAGLEAEKDGDEDGKKEKHEEEKCPKCGKHHCECEKKDDDDNDDDDDDDDDKKKKKDKDDD